MDTPPPFLMLPTRPPKGYEEIMRMLNELLSLRLRYFVRFLLSPPIELLPTYAHEFQFVRPQEAVTENPVAVILPTVLFVDYGLYANVKGKYQIENEVLRSYLTERGPFQLLPTGRLVVALSLNPYLLDINDHGEFAPREERYVVVPIKSFEGSRRVGAIALKRSSELLPAAAAHGTNRPISVDESILTAVLVPPYLISGQPATEVFNEPRIRRPLVAAHVGHAFKHILLPESQREEAPEAMSMSMEEEGEEFTAPRKMFKRGNF